MNLATDKWIPVVWFDGRHDKVSLTAIFNAGDKIADLSVRPHERIALMRLLICIAQAAIDGPEDREDWRACKARLPQAALDYLRKWEKAFELFGDGPRFLQAKGEGNPGPAEITKLDFVDKDMTTLFDPTVSVGEIKTDEWIALHLLVYQSFAAGGQVGGSLNGHPQTGKNAPCRDSSAFHTFIRKVDMLATIHANLVSREHVKRSSLVWGEPVWEYESVRISGFVSDEHLPHSYLGRLVPISRAIWLHEGRGFGSLHANGVDYASFSDQQVRDTTTTIRLGKDDKRMLVGAASAEGVKRPWRELHALMMKSVSEKGAGGPMILECLDSTASFDLWVGAVATSKAKVEDLIESVFVQLPAELLDPTVQKAYETGVRLANRVETRLRRAIAAYRLAMETAEQDLAGIRRTYASLRRSEKQQLGNIAEKAQSLFWTLTETHLDLLLRFCTQPLPMENSQPQPNATDWGKSLWRTARTAYDSACSQETPRQLRAYALGMEELFRLPQENEEATE